MSWQVNLAPEVEKDVAQAAEWYEQRREGLGVGGCKSLSVNWSLDVCSSNPFGGRRSEGERSESSAAAPRRGCAARFASLVAGHSGLLVEVYQNISKQHPHDPPERF